ncbi:major facilitator superfamily domain-containing protein [Microdochium bolleyi]|uniref:Major facilitator superfamily domain-containing protein n=1 Tax=Microdochium bolleyi TaxID=196109 RepID=A0A136JJY0_9PEZI|nr:major facilitator superfamily domain-containing protein [Microdochium bolleyi]
MTKEQVSPVEGSPERTGKHYDVESPSQEPQCPSSTTERKLMSRIDAHLLPFVIILYLLAFLDRVNIANARSFSMEKDLGMDVGGTQYNAALVIFFPPYILFEIPSNIFLKRFSPKVWLPACMLGFGLITTFQGLVQNFAGLLVTRFLLGLFEAGLFPGCFYLLSMWYKREEAQKRYSLFFASTSLAGAFGGLLASAIGKMDGLNGYHGWRWIFILEGVLTCLVAFIFYPFFPTFPEEATFLTEEERAYVKLRLQRDTGNSAAERKTSFRDVLTVMKDYRIYLGGFMYFGLIVPAYGYAYFAPAIISTYGYDPIRTQLFSVPPWAASFGFSLVIAALSDRFRHRATFALAPLALAITGFAILLNIHNNTPVQYMALCFVTMGCYGAMPIIVCWFVMNLGGHHRRAIGAAWQVGFGNIGGIIATFAFLAKDRPFYVPGYSICIAFTILSALASTTYLLSITRDNRKRANATTDVVLTEQEKSDLGDLRPDFRYMY